MSEGFSISLELILLMNWLLKNEKYNIKTIIKNSLQNGLLTELNQTKINKESLNDINFLHNTILDFLILLEDSLLEELGEKLINENSKDTLKPTLQKIKPGVVDLKTIWQNMDQAQYNMPKEAIKDIKDDKMKDMFFYQILKNWNPKESEPIN